MEDRTTVSRLFGASGIFYAGLIDEILPHLTTHEYLFLTDEFFREWQSTSDYNVARENQIVASELIDKAHLAAATALIRTRQWIKATCSAYDCQNLVAWASAARGLIESSGDTLDGLINIAGSIANAHQVISSAIRGYQSTRGLNFAEIEQVLDHYVLATWMRGPRSEVRKAKDNIEYVRALEPGVPKIVEFYHRICGLTHPSSSSIDYLYDVRETGLRLDVGRDGIEIDRLCNEFRDVLPDSLVFACNPALLILKVLHKFRMHPQLSELKKVKWSAIPAWVTIEKSLGG
jgi:hypothetical protein